MHRRRSTDLRLKVFQTKFDSLRRCCITPTAKGVLAWRCGCYHSPRVAVTQMQHKTPAQGKQHGQAQPGLGGLPGGQSQS